MRIAVGRAGLERAGGQPTRTTRPVFVTQVADPDSLTTTFSHDLAEVEAVLSAGRATNQSVTTASAATSTSTGMRLRLLGRAAWSTAAVWAYWGAADTSAFSARWTLDATPRSREPEASG